VPLILHLETATDVCSVCLANQGSLVSIAEDLTVRSHASSITLLIQQVLQGASQKTLQEIDAVAISQGPGSYTGLRIGTATAKGICYGLKKPLISVPTLYSLSKTFISKFSIESHSLLIPCLDARRMEIYSEVYDPALRMIQSTQAQLVNPDSFTDLANQYSTLYFIGSGALKLETLLKLPNALYYSEFRASSIGMIEMAHRKFQSLDFENSSQFEPFYLKDFLTKKTI